MNRARPRGARSGRRRRGGRRRILLLLVAAAALAGAGAAGWVASLDRQVVSRFEGRLFRLPSRVYSAPTVLYPGARVTLRELVARLERLGYRPGRPSGPLAPGRYRLRASRLRVHLRAFSHPTRPEPARVVELLESRGRIVSIRDPRSGRERSAVFLEPELVGFYYGPHREQRELVRLEQLPRPLIEAVLAVEDRRFLHHHGIDWRRVVGALWADLRAGAIRQGGSTITQQLVKNFFLTPERSLRRKLQEAVMALLVEARYEKREILEAYLNEVYLGQVGGVAIHGVGEAARVYLGKPARALDLSESALLAGMIQSPNALSPFRNPERARRRRDLVLRLMRRQGRISEAELARALAAPLPSEPPRTPASEAPYFLDVLRRQLPAAYDEQALASEGLRIHSTIEMPLQRAARAALREGLAELERRYPWLKSSAPGRELEGCVLAIRPQTGEVLALVGGRDYRVSQFDRCTQARRPVGSAFKPIVYLAALEPRDGESPVTLASRLRDEPLTVETPEGPWSPTNYDHRFHGSVSLREALEGSLNVATVQLAQRIGIDRIVTMARRLGITSPLPRVPSLALGTAELSPLELARAYATLASGGVRPEIRTFQEVVDLNGRTLARRPIAFARVLAPGLAFLGVSLLEGVVERGTARAVREAGLRGPIGGKTGTSDDWRDAWFVGFTPELVAVVWVGFDEPRSLGLPSSRVALPIWVRFMRRATGGVVRGAFLAPSDVVGLDVDPTTGARALPGCPRKVREFFLPGTEPRTTCPPQAVAERRSRERPGPLRRLLRRWFGGGP